MNDLDTIDADDAADDALAPGRAGGSTAVAQRRASPATPEEQRIRIATICAMLADSRRVSEICDYSAAKWGLSRKTTRKYISAARRRLREHFDEVDVVAAAASSVEWWLAVSRNPEIDWTTRCGARARVDDILGVKAARHAIEHRARRVGDEGATLDGATPDGSVPPGGEEPSIDALLEQLTGIAAGGGAIVPARSHGRSHERTDD